MVAGEREGDVRAGDCRGARATVSLQDIAIDRQRAFAKGFHVGDRAQTATDQSLNLMRAAGWSTTADLARRSGLRRAWQHRVLSGEPALAAVAQKGRHAV